MIITITGIAGSGKSTLAKDLAKKLNFKYYSIGELQRKLASEKNISLSQLRNLEISDPSFDKEFDEYQKKIGLSEDNFVMESRLGAFFIPDSFKVFLDCIDDIRYKRILDDTNHNRFVELTGISKEKILSRDREDANRLKNIYGFNYLDESNYDLIVDTSYKTRLEVLDIVVKSYLKKFISKKL